MATKKTAKKTEAKKTEAKWESKGRAGWEKQSTGGDFPEGEFVPSLNEGDSIEGTLTDAFVMLSSLTKQPQMIYVFKDKKDVQWKLSERVVLRVLRTVKTGTQFVIEVGPEKDTKRKGQRVRLMDVFTNPNQKPAPSGPTMTACATKATPELAAALFGPAADESEEADGDPDDDGSDVAF